MCINAHAKIAGMRSVLAHLARWSRFVPKYVDRARMCLCEKVVPTHQEHACNPHSSVHSTSHVLMVMYSKMKGSLSWSNNCRLPRSYLCAGRYGERGGFQEKTSGWRTRTKSAEQASKETSTSEFNKKRDRTACSFLTRTKSRMRPRIVWSPTFTACRKTCTCSIDRCSQPTNANAYTRRLA
jgi:hypothetical protein